jgi:hypothetical protein
MLAVAVVAQPLLPQATAAQVQAAKVVVAQVATVALILFLSFQEHLVLLILGVVVVEHHMVQWEVLVVMAGQAVQV